MVGDEPFERAGWAADDRGHVAGDPVGVALGEQGYRLGVHRGDVSRDTYVDHCLLLLFEGKRMEGRAVRALSESTSAASA